MCVGGVLGEITTVIVPQMNTLQRREVKLQDGQDRYLFQAWAHGGLAAELQGKGLESSHILNRDTV